MSCEIRIGTSGFHYKHWKGPFYPEKMPASKMLAFYVQHFDTVELNNSFYRLPTASAFDEWRESTPSKFVFAVKASRFITHNKKLKDPENALDNLLPRAAHLGAKLGPILFQLPPHWRVNMARLESLLEVLPRDLRYTFEFREPSWIIAAVDSILRKFNAAFCIYELAGYHSPIASPPTLPMFGCTGQRARNIRAATPTKSCANGRGGLKPGPETSKLSMFISTTINSVTPRSMP